MIYKKKLNQIKKEFDNLCIFTSTKYGEEKISIVRYPLFFKLLRNCNKLGIKIMVVDSSSNILFLQKLNKLKNINIIKSDAKLGEKRREALKKLAQDKNNKYFLWIEPEKYDLIKTKFLIGMIKKLNIANIVIPSRKNIEQMPNFFASIEKKALKKIKNEILKSDIEYDLWFGPKMFDKIGLKYFLNYNNKGDKTDLWDAHIIPVIQAYEDGLKITSIEVDYKYDKSEIDVEDTLKEKRIYQYNSIFYEILKK